MIKKNFNIEKVLGSIKFVLKNLGGATDFHKLFKILYFAERKHIATYGRSITDDRYVAMQAGPVPSTIYDILKYLREGSIFDSPIDFSKHFEIRDKYWIYLLDAEFNFELFSESEIDCLSESIDENKYLTFNILKKKSHDSAWSAAGQDDSMSIFEIARAGGANDELLKYITLRSDNKNLKVN